MKLKLSLGLFIVSISLFCNDNLKESLITLKTRFINLNKALKELSKPITPTPTKPTKPSITTPDLNKQFTQDLTNLEQQLQQIQNDSSNVQKNITQFFNFSWQDGITKNNNLIFDYKSMDLIKSLDVLKVDGTYYLIKIPVLQFFSRIDEFLQNIGKLGSYFSVNGITPQNSTNFIKLLDTSSKEIIDNSLRIQSVDPKHLNIHLFQEKSSNNIPKLMQTTNYHIVTAKIFESTCPLDN